MWHYSCTCGSADFFDSGAPKKYQALAEAYAIHPHKGKDHIIVLTAVDPLVAAQIRAERKKASGEPVVR